MTETEGEQGGRIFFSSAGRSLEDEDEIRLTTVGIDIGSSTSHLVFSRLVLERTDTRYVVAERTVLWESEIMLTPYSGDDTIDAVALGRFIEQQYAAAGLGMDDVDTGALILTGVAVRRANARAIGDIFSAQAGRLVAVSAGDALEATLAAFGSGAAARSRAEVTRVMNLDIGGGTTKIAVCERGSVVEQTAIDIGARVVAFDAEGRVARLEESGRRFAQEAGAPLALGALPPAGALDLIVALMAERLFEVITERTLSAQTSAFLRLDPLKNERKPDTVTVSGGVAAYFYEPSAPAFRDLGPALARAIRMRLESWGPRIEPPAQAIRATVIGASQYTIQVSGSTIFVSPAETLPLRNIPVLAPELPLSADVVDEGAIAAAIGKALRRLELEQGDQPVALWYSFSGSASFSRLRAFVQGVVSALSRHLARGQPLILVGNNDIGGLIGIHCVEEARIKNPIVSIDGVSLQDLDHIDIGALLPVSGAVPVVVKSLVFPT